MTAPASRKERVLVLGIGNLLLQDDGAGIHLVNALMKEGGLPENVWVRDGGTIGLSLLPEIEQADRLIVLDAARIGGQPGDWAVFRNADMDAHLSRSRSSVHEVALSDILDGARLNGRLPKERMLVGIEPASTDWGMDPTAPVAAALPHVLEFVQQELKEWSDANAVV